MHDPNLEVCGKGFLRLQNAGVPTKLFPWNLTLRIKAPNEEFIRAQQCFGITITHPQNGEFLATEAGRKITLCSPWINPPTEHDHVIAMVQRGTNWWFQSKLDPVIGHAEQWTSVIHIGEEGLHKVFVGKLNPLGGTLNKYYYKIIKLHEDWRDSLRQQLNNPQFQLPGDHWVPVEMRDLPEELIKKTKLNSISRMSFSRQFHVCALIRLLFYLSSQYICRPSEDASSCRLGRFARSRLIT